MPKISFVLSVLLAVLAAARPAAAQGVRHLEGVVNINTASAEELRLLSGIGPAKVKNILAYRRTRAFRTIEELARVKGIGRKMVRRLRMHLAVSGPTTAQQVIRAVSEPDAVTGPGPAPPAPAARPPAPAPRPPAAFQRRPAGAAPPARPGARPSRLPLPEVVFPDADANHCIRPR
jgi:competence protein ComEA